MPQQPSKSVAQRVHGYGQRLPLTTVDGKESLRHRDRNFLRLKTNYGTIPANNPVLAVSAASTRLNGVAACGA
jgi:ribosomal protein L34